MVEGTWDCGAQQVKADGCSDSQSLCSGIVVYGGGDTVFRAQRSNQGMEWMQGSSGLVVYGGLVPVFDSHWSNQWNQWMQSGQWIEYTVDALRHSVLWIL